MKKNLAYLLNGIMLGMVAQLFLADVMMTKTLKTSRTELIQKLRDCEHFTNRSCEFWAMPKTFAKGIK